ncbi:hypothetical protein LC55x_2698 [Lysobacter capsici]|nr:hypothetical protein LC55x_2698 [Lysobacter capsici]
MPDGRNDGRAGPTTKWNPGNDAESRRCRRQRAAAGWRRSRPRRPRG